MTLVNWVVNFFVLSSLIIYLCKVALAVIYQGSIRKNLFISVMPLSLIRIRLCTSNPLKPHPRWEPLNGVRIIKCFCYCSLAQCKILVESINYDCMVKVFEVAATAI